MARLNEAPLSSDSLETLRRKMLRQNRDLAKSNNVRALRIRELEGECALMLSENLELRSRILELEKQLEDNTSRRIADHAMAIRVKMEAQLAEWSTLLSGLGSEPPLKRRHSPSVRRSLQPRMSFSAARTSPSQRRLREIARDIEELGSIAERPSSRQSLNPEQIRALQCKADAAILESLDKPTRLEQEPTKTDFPAQPPPAKPDIIGTRNPLEPPVSLHSPKAHKSIELPLPSPEKPKAEPLALLQKPPGQAIAPVRELDLAPPRLGAKRKFSQDELNMKVSRPLSDENAPQQGDAEKTSIRQKAGGKTLKELAHIRKVDRQRQAVTSTPRKPLAPKNNNDDIASPKKPSKLSAADEVVKAKTEIFKSKPVRVQTTASTKSNAPMRNKDQAMEKASTAESSRMSDLAAKVQENASTLDSSGQASGEIEPRSDTPPPAEISLGGETSRPSRRNRTAVSYAEPNLRDKMRRPTKELFDAVTGEGKYTRRASHCDQQLPDGPKIKRESDAGESSQFSRSMGGSLGGSPSSLESSSDPARHPNEKSTGSNHSEERTKYRLRTVSAHPKPAAIAVASGLIASDSNSGTSINEGDGVDVYEFASSSPQVDKEAAVEATKDRLQQGATTRRRSAAVDSAKGTATKERSASRRRSMMI